MADNGHGSSAQGDYLPPQNLDAEVSVLGALMIAPNLVAAVTEILRPEHFYRRSHQVVYEVIEGLYARGEPIDPITVSEELSNAGSLEAAGGRPFVHSLISAVPAAANARHYAEIVHENYLLRSLIDVGGRIADMGYRRDGTPADLIDRAEQAVFDIAQSRASNEFSPISDLITESFAELEKIVTEGHRTTGVETGFKRVDDIILGLQPANLVILAARPSMGKTAFALNVARNVAVDQKKGVALFSLEMSKFELVQRLMCSEARVDSNKLRHGLLGPGEWTKLTAACAPLYTAPLFVDDTASVNLMEIRAKARRLKAKEKNLGLIIIDYLQLMVGDSSAENRQQEISRISRGLKILARDLDVPVLALSQLSRQVEQRAGNRPVLSDLRECVTGDTLVMLADGRRLPIAGLVGTAPEVLAVEEGRIVTATSDEVWHVGTRPVFRVRLASGRSIRATGRHRLLGARGWVRVERLTRGDRLAIARRVPEPIDPVEWPRDRVALLGQLIGDGSYLSGQPMRYTTASVDNSALVTSVAEMEFGCRVTAHPGRGNWHQLVIAGNGDRWRPAGVNEWLRRLGVFGQRSHQKRVPARAFRLSNRLIAILLRHLWATDGTISTRAADSRGSSTISFSTVSPGLAMDVAALLLRLGIVGRIRQVRHGDSSWFTVGVSGVDEQRRFLATVGAFGPRAEPAHRLEATLVGKVGNTNVDTLPRDVFAKIRVTMASRGVTQRQMASMRGTSYGGTAHFSFAPSRATVADYADLLGDDRLRAEASNDLFWDRIVEVVPDGEEDVFDLTVPGPASWLADGIVSHNSGAIEQDADVVLFIYRDEVYNRESQEKGLAEIIVGKQRNGPIGDCKLAFIQSYTRFADMPGDTRQRD